MKSYLATAFYRWVCATGMLFASLFILVFVLFPHGQAIDNLINPVRDDWVILKKVYDKNDVVISGTMRQLRECSFQPPPRARDHLGNYLLVESPTDYFWVAGPDAQNWGPWRIINGKGKELELFMIDKCHFMWTNTTVLGELHGN